MALPSCTQQEALSPLENIQNNFWLQEALSKLCPKFIAQSKEGNSTPGAKDQLITPDFLSTELLCSGQRAETWIMVSDLSSSFLKATRCLKPTSNSWQKDLPESRREVVLALPLWWHFDLLWSPFPNGLPSLRLLLAVFDVRGKDRCRTRWHSKMYSLPWALETETWERTSRSHLSTFCFKALLVLPKLSWQRLMYLIMCL